MKTLFTFSIVILLLCSVAGANGYALAQTQPTQTQPGQTQPAVKPPAPASLGAHPTAQINDEIRHQLLTLPYYGVFDWLEAETGPDYTVTLRGQVTRPTTKTDAEARVQKLEGVAKVVNEIEVLPLSPGDDDIRVAMYRALFNYSSPLFTKYGTRAVSPIHIIVKNGRVTLKGIVANDTDRQLAVNAAKGVSNVFEVKDELKVEENSSN